MYTPPLHKLPHGAARGSPAAGLNPREYLPQDAMDAVLEQLIAGLGADELCTTLYERCLLLTPPGAPGARPRCGPGRPLWKKACERMGLTRMSEGDWHATFQRLCRQLRRLAKPFSNAAWEGFAGNVFRREAIETYLARVRGEYIPYHIEYEVLQYIIAQGHLALVAEAFVGLGAVPVGYIPNYFNAAQAAIASGDVAAIRGVIGTGPNAGVRELVDASDGEVQKVRLLLSMGVNVNALWTWETSLLMVCVYSLPNDHQYDASTQCIELLLQAGANVNWASTVADRDSALTRLLRDDDRMWEDSHEGEQVLMDRCRLLLNYGANPNHVTANGETPLMLAQRFRDHALKNDLVEALKAYGAVA